MEPTPENLALSRVPPEAFVPFTLNNNTNKKVVSKNGDA